MNLTELEEVVSELKKIAEDINLPSKSYFKLDSSKVLDFISFYGQVGDQG